METFIQDSIKQSSFILDKNKKQIGKWCKKKLAYPDPFSPNRGGEKISYTWRMYYTKERNRLNHNLTVYVYLWLYIISDKPDIKQTPNLSMTCNRSIIQDVTIIAKCFPWGLTKMREESKHHQQWRTWSKLDSARSTLLQRANGSRADAVMVDRSRNWSEGPQEAIPIRGVAKKDKEP